MARIKTTRQALMGIIVTTVSIVALALLRGRMTPGERVGLVCWFIIFAYLLVAQFLLWVCSRRCQEHDPTCEEFCRAVYMWLTILIPVIALICLLAGVLD